MSTLRIARLRACRPQLSPRYEYLRRHESTSAASTAPNASAPSSAPAFAAPPPPPRSFARRYRGTLICAALALGAGLGAGSYVTMFLAPPVAPRPGSHGDAVLQADIVARLDNEFKVNVLRGKCLGVAKQLKGAEAGWVEIVSEDNSKSVPGGPLISNLQGASRLGAERVFWDRSKKQLVAVVWFGGELSGWPGVTHGGMLATALTEKIALAAHLADGYDDASSAAAISQRLPGTGCHAKMRAPSPTPSVQPATLNLAYAAPTYANSFYVIRVSPVSFPFPDYAALSAEAKARDPHSRLRDVFTSGDGYDATIETTDGKVCVIAQAKMPETSSMKSLGGAVVAAERNAVEGAKEKYKEFRRWMWPSRQAQSSEGR